MDSFGNSSMQGSSVPMNPMMAMIQRQQQEQQQYEALTAGTTLGVTNTNGMGNQNSSNTTVPPSSSTTSDNTATSYMNTSFPQDSFQQRQVSTTGSIQHRLPQQLPMNEMPTMYSQARSTFPEMNNTPLQQQQPMMMQHHQQQQQHHQQQLMFNVGNLSPSHSPAPNHTQFYSNVDMQPSYYPDMQTSYMNMVSPAFMASTMDGTTSSYMPLQQSMPSTMMQQYSSSNNYSHMSYSPVPQMFMTNNNMSNSNSASYEGPDANFPLPPTVSSSLKLGGYTTDNMNGSNLTSMPVQAPPTMLPSNNNSTPSSDPFQSRRDSSTKSMASPTTPTHPPPPPLPPSSSSTTTTPAPPPPSTSDTAVAPPTVTYIPKTRQVETYGGVDLKYFEKFEIRPAVPCWEELGAVNMTALTLSLRSGIKMEMTNALNILTTLTMQPRPLLLTHCDGLLDTILDHIQATIFPNSFDDHSTTTITDHSTSLTYADLFELSLSEMKSLIPNLAPTSSQEWASQQELRLCLLNILRNASFMEENIDYLATHPRLCPLLINIIQLTRYFPNNNNNNNGDLRCMDILEFRKCVLTIYANIAIATNVSADIDPWVFLIHDFIVHGTDTYYAMLAMEAWNKCSVHETRRRILLSSSSHTVAMIQEIWTALISMLRRQFYMVEMGMMVGMNSGQLGTLELVVMGMYNVVALADLGLNDHLIMLEPGVAMTLLRICLTLAEANNPHFRVVAHRGMETVYALALGGGIKMAQLIQQQRNHVIWQQQKQQQLEKKQQAGMVVFPLTKSDLDDEDTNYKKGVTARTRKLLNQAVLQEKIMMVMLKPAADLVILSGLDDLLTLMDGMVFDD